MARQALRVASLFGGHYIDKIGVKSDLEAAGCLIDALDALGAREGGLVLVNVAPRHGKAKKWPNGSPFGYFHYYHTLVLASIDGLTLSLAKKLGCLTEINVFFVPAVTQVMAQHGLIPKKSIERINNSQFRSFDVIPHVAYCLLKGIRIPSVVTLVEEIVPDPPKAVWYVDCFGNVKTTILPEEVNFLKIDKLETRVGVLPCYHHLVDVPDGQVALVDGSSGLEDKRFLEIVAPGGKAAEMLGPLGLQVGQVLL